VFSREVPLAVRDALRHHDRGYLHPHGLGSRVRRTEAKVLDVIDRFVKELGDVVVVKPIDDTAAIAVARHESECPQ
jgi:hypothetical protein